MDTALSQYYEKRTTMAESIKQVSQLDYPVLVFCPDPGFKPSFFKDIKNKITGMEKYLWKFTWQKIILENASSIPEEYSNMSYILGEDWNIAISPWSFVDEGY